MLHASSTPEVYGLAFRLQMPVEVSWLRHARSTDPNTVAFTSSKDSDSTCK